MKIAEEAINETANKIVSLIEMVVKSDRKEKILQMMEDLKDLYFLAPASSKEQYHYCFPGGLAIHSLNVYKNLRKLNKAFDFNFTEEEMLISALFHDLGKACATNCKDPHYIPSTEEWKLKRGEVYEYKNDDVHFPNHQRSMFILQKYGIPLSSSEYQAILLNDGQYIEENKGYKMKECPLALALHIADRIGCYLEGKEGKPEAYR